MTVVCRGPLTLKVRNVPAPLGSVVGIGVPPDPVEGLLVTPTDEDIDFAGEAYEGGEAATASVVDHVSYAVMRRSGLTEVFSSDAHFRWAGFRTLF